MKSEEYRFYALVSRMRYITRWGLMRNTFSENVQEHSHMVAVLAHGLALIRRDILGLPADPERCATAALFHDASEILTGDLPTPVKYYNPDIRAAYKQVERVSADKLLELLPEALAPELCSARAGVRPHGARHRQGGGQALGAHQVHRGAARGKSGICLGSRADKAGPDGHAPAGAGLVSGALSGQLWKKSRSIGIIFTALLRLPTGKLAGSLFESPYIVILQNIPL